MIMTLQMECIWELWQHDDNSGGKTYFSQLHVITYNFACFKIFCVHFLGKKLALSFNPAKKKNFFEQK